MSESNFKYVLLWNAAPFDADYEVWTEETTVDTFVEAVRAFDLHVKEYPHLGAKIEKTCSKTLLNYEGPENE